jgi:ferric-dicitrate binding protein FerR (iron transport regulator)
MRPRLLQLGSLVVLLAFVGQASWAQDGERLREWRARQEARREAAAERRANGGGAGKGQPNERAMEGLPPKWIDRVRDMPPEQQQQFFENNAQFRQLPPARQEQIRQNLEKWNRLSPQEKDAVRQREQFLDNLPPEQREYVRGTLLPKWQALPQPRRQAINQHLAMLRNMSPSTQQAALNDPKFVQGLSPDERSMLRDLNSLRNPSDPAEQTPPQ